MKIKNWPGLVDSQDDASKVHVDKKFDDPSIIRNTGHVSFHKNLDIVRFVEVTSYAAVVERLTAIC